MTIDELGFIHPIKIKEEYEKKDHCAKSQIYYKIDEEHPLINSKIPGVRKIRAKNNCWICEGWREMYFSHKQDKNATNYDTDDVTNSSKIHLNFEKYKGFDMTKLKKESFTYRMCPPGEILYYYTVNGDVIKNYGKNTFRLKDETSNFTHNETTTYGFGNTTNYNSTYYGKTSNNSFNKTLKIANSLNSLEEEEYLPQKVNVFGRIMNEINDNVICANEYSKLLKYCVPRPRKDNKIDIKPRTPWSFPISLWATYFDYNWSGDNEVIMSKD